MTTTIDAELSRSVVAAAAGGDVAFGRIVAAHHGEMVRVCMVIARDPGIAEEAVQLDRG